MARQDRQQAMAENDEMAAKALRVLAIAYRDVQSLPKELEQGLHFVGLFGMMDPPRPEVAAAVRTCKTAGVKAVMITGDHVRTAVAVARSIGMFAPGDDAITGAELSKLSDDELARCIGDYTVFARVTPEHKVRIVKAFPVSYTPLDVYTRQTHCGKEDVFTDAAVLVVLPSVQSARQHTG